jgi:hypothetical protein
MNRREQETILREVLGSEEELDFRRTTLETGLKAMGQRRRRRMVRLGFLTVTPIVAALVLWFKGAVEPWATQAKRTEQAQVSAQSKNDDVKLISDQELFALFPNRPMALIGSPGHQQLVFLGEEGGGTTE